MNQGYKCATCGQHHAELPLVLGAAAPAAYEAVPVAERAERCALSLCIIDNEHFFVLGRRVQQVVEKALHATDTTDTSTIASP